LEIMIMFLFSSELSTVDPSGHHLLNRLSCPLWGHVSDALDSGESETFILLSVSGNLLGSVPWSPCFNEGPVKSLDPSLGAVCWNSAIGVT